MSHHPEQDAANSLSPGLLVTPHVRLVEPIGQGAMGAVWAAEHLTLGRPVAVKFISPQLAQDPILLARFKREARAAAQIKDPHVVQIFDSGTLGAGIPFIVMELLVGETLEQKLDRVGRLGLPDLSLILSQCAGALDKAHARGIVHRDLKPGNVFLTETATGLFVKLLDFGVAKHSEVTSDGTLTTTHSVIGTPAYMSPEQILFPKQTDHRADLWGLAVLAYEALTGRMPFEQEELIELCRAICDESVAPPSSLGLGLPTALDGWLDRALAKDPLERFVSASEMAQELVTIARDSSRLAVDEQPLQPSVSERTGSPRVAQSLTHEPAPPISKTRFAAAVVVSAIVLISGISLIVYGFGLEDETRTSETVASSTITRDPQCVISEACSISGRCGKKTVKGVCIAVNDEDCRKSLVCRERGLCVRQKLRCVATRQRDCRSSRECTKLGACAATKGKCKPGSREDCADSDRCKIKGLCSYQEHECIARTNEDCGESQRCVVNGECEATNGRCSRPPGVSVRPRQCTEHGRCTRADGGLVVGSDEDCRRSVACFIHGMCTADSGMCKAATDYDCKKSFYCIEKGRCSLVQGGCFATSNNECLRSVACKRDRRCSFEKSESRETGSCVK